LCKLAGIGCRLALGKTLRKMFAAWFTSANAARFGVFENQDRAAVKRLIFEHFDGSRCLVVNDCHRECRRMAIA
jgi:hypothetical protein